MFKEYKKSSTILFQKYRPIEIDHQMSVSEKIPHMIKWYTESHEIMIACNLDKPLLKVLVGESRAFLR